MPGLGHSPAISTPYLEVDTPFTPPFFDIESDISPYLAFASFNNTPMLKQDICLSNYIQQGASAEFNGDPTELLIDKSKTPQWPSYTLDIQHKQDNGLFPPLGNSQLTNDYEEQPDEFNTFMDFGSPLSEPEPEPEQEDEYRPEKEFKPSRVEKPKRIERPKRVEKSKRGKSAQGKLHQCPYCDHVSKRRYNLSTHIKTHNKQRVKEFECEQCHSRFDRRHDRDRHLATVHRGKRALVCKCCSIRFSRRDALNRHLAQRQDQVDDFD
ncbi:unnamed protein product [Rhizopus stolonifer]